MLKKVGFYPTCLAGLLRPEMEASCVRLLRQAGFEPFIAATQTCCGQPAVNAGLRAQAKQLARKCAAEFAECETVVVPSGSCAATLRNHLADLFAQDEPGRQQVAALAGKCQELSVFLTEHKFVPETAPRSLKITYHDSCTGLRELDIKHQPRQLLSAAGHQIVEMAEAETCCGFGGTFAAKFGDVSGHLADRKCSCAQACPAQLLAAGDIGCLLSIEGRMLRRGSQMAAVHFAEILDINSDFMQSCPT